MMLEDFEDAGSLPLFERRALHDKQNRAMVKEISSARENMAAMQQKVAYLEMMNDDLEKRLEFQAKREMKKQAECTELRRELENKESEMWS